MSYVIRAVGGFFLDIIETVVIALSIFLIVYLFLMQPHQVNGQSMVPTFQDKEYLLTDKVTYKRRAPERGEVVVFHAPDGAGCPQGAGCDFIKRIIGVPGDQIEVKNGNIYLNGQLLEEPFLPDSYVTDAGAYSRGRLINLGQGEYFVVGDNRSHSSDSRAWGPIQYSDIVGRVFFRYWPLQKTGLIEQIKLP